MVLHLSILLIIGIVVICNADLYSALSVERQTESVISWTKQSTCGPVNYKSGIYKQWKLDDTDAPRNTGTCSGQCRQAGPNNCKGFVFYYRKKNCLLLNYEADKSQFKSHVSAACGYWIQSTLSPTSAPTLSSTSMNTPSISMSPTEPQCKVKIHLKFGNKPDDIPTMGTHNDYLIVTKKSKKRTFQSCCYMQQTQPYCQHDGGDAVFENFTDEYYDYIESEEVNIPKARGGEFLLEVKHYFNDFEAAYYGAGYADHTIPAEMVVTVNGKFLKKVSHSKNRGRNTHLNLEHREPDINPEYLGYIKAKLKCNKDCECKMVVWKRTKRPKDGPCDLFDIDDDATLDEVSEVVV